MQVFEVLFTAQLSIGNALNAVGDVLSARDEFEHAHRVFEGSVGFPVKLETDKISLLFELSHVLWTLGYPGSLISDPSRTVNNRGR